jgi:hypothetical protein
MTLEEIRERLRYIRGTSKLMGELPEMEFAVYMETSGRPEVLNVWRMNIDLYQKLPEADRPAKPLVFWNGIADVDLQNIAQGLFDRQSSK